MLGILYDIHGNLVALDAVLAEPELVAADRFLLGGDYCLTGPWQQECLDRLRTLPDATWIRGNGERWLVEPPTNVPEILPATQVSRSLVGEEQTAWLYGLPTSAEIDGVLYVHGSTRSDVESFTPEPSANDERLLGGVTDRTVVFGHSHLQFRRPGPNGTELLNPGSVGMPLDGDTRAGWAYLTDDGKFELRRTEYDFMRAAAAYRLAGGELGETLGRRIELASD
jgi:predicted phosphodiesterase